MTRSWKRQQMRMAALCCGVGLLTASLLPAQQRERGEEQAVNPQSQQLAGEKQFCLATELIGMQVKVQGEEEWGTIKNLIINREGAAQYLAVSAEAQAASATPRARNLDRERPGTARQQSKTDSKLTLVPWDAVKFHQGATADQSYVAVDIEKDRLTSAPSFTQHQLTAPDGQAQIMVQVETFFGRKERGAARPDLNRGAEEDRSPLKRQPEREDN